MVAKPVVAVFSRPPFVAIEHPFEAFTDAGLLGKGRRQPWDAGVDRHEAVEAIGMIRDELELPGLVGEADEDRALHSGRVQHGDGVRNKLVVNERRGAGWSVGATVSARIVGHDTMPASKVGDLRLPHPGMKDRPAEGCKEQRWFAAVVRFVMEADAVPLDESIVVRVSGSCLLAAG